MRKVIFQVNMSLDGFTAGLDGNLDWVIIDQDQWRDLVSLYDRLDTVLLGRVNYEGFYGYWPAVANDATASETDRTFARWVDDVPKVVFSSTLARAEWKNSRLAQGDITNEIARLKQQPGKDMLVMNSTTLAHSLLAHDLIDEFWLTLQPAAIGDGLRLFADLPHKLTLQLLDAKQYATGVMFVRYARVQPA